MTDTQHEHVQRDLAALRAAEKKAASAAERVREAAVLHDDARRALDLAHQKFHLTVNSSAIPQNGCSRF